MENYPVAARAECSGGEGASYVELLTCFQVKDWMKHPDQIGGVTGTGSAQAKGRVTKENRRRAARRLRALILNTIAPKQLGSSKRYFESTTSTLTLSSTFRELCL
jgi:hypothetical protein